MSDESSETKNDTTPAPAQASNGVETRDVVEEPEPAHCARCAVLRTVSAPDAKPAMYREHPAAPGLCLTCGHAVIVETAIERFSELAKTIHAGLEQLASTPQGAAVLSQLAGPDAPASAAEALAELGDEAKRVDLVDVTNLFAVSTNGQHTVILAAVDRTKLPQQSVLNLCAWLSVLADLTDGDLIAARRKVEST
jgi:hypothetical protein